MLPRDPRYAQTGLIALIILQSVMLLSLYAGVAPHPPAATPLFGIGPFLGAALSCAAGALLFGRTETRAGRGLAVLAVLAALVSFGPQKYFDAQFAQIWPAVLSGQLASAVVLLAVFKTPAAAQA